MARRVKGLQTRTFDIIKGTQNENLLATPVAMPTAYGDPQLSFTIIADNLTIIRGAEGVGYQTVPIINLYLQSGTASYATMYFKMYVNGVQVGVETSITTAAASKQTNRTVIVPVTVKVGDVVALSFKAAANVCTVHGGRLILLPYGMFGKQTKGRNIYVQSAKVLAITDIFSGTIGRTATFVNDTSGAVRIRRMGDGQTNSYKGSLYDWTVYNPSGLNQYLSGGGATDCKDTANSWLYFNTNAKFNTSESATDITTGLSINKQLFVSKMLVKYKEL